MIMYGNADNCMEIFWGLFIGGGGVLLERDALRMEQVSIANSVNSEENHEHDEGP